MSLRLICLALLLAACSSTTTDGGSGAGNTGSFDLGTLGPDTAGSSGDGAGGDLGSGAGDVGMSTSDSGKTDAGNKAGFGQPCQANSDCKSGYCIDGYAGHVCSEVCNGDCPVGYACQKVFSGNKPVMLCVPQVSKICHVCNDDLDCAGGSCVKSGDEQFCAPSCAPGAPPDLIRCRPTSASRVLVFARPRA